MGHQGFTTKRYLWISRPLWATYVGTPEQNPSSILISELIKVRNWVVENFDGISPGLMPISNHWNCLKNGFFLLFSQFFRIFSIQWTQKPVEANLSNIKYHWEHREWHIWPFGTCFRPGKKVKKSIFQTIPMVGYGHFQTLNMFF